jgi:hypothetical protein
MSPADETELHRLSDMLAAIDSSLPSDSPLREGLAKAGLALALGFIQGMRADIEQQFEQLGDPLSDEQRAYLKRLGIDPET